jgi:hypothetical protein
MTDGDAQRDIPQDKLGETVQRLADWDNRTHIRCEKQADGKWTVVVLKP